MAVVEGRGVREGETRWEMRKQPAEYAGRKEVVGVYGGIGWWFGVGVGWALLGGLRKRGEAE